MNKQQQRKQRIRAVMAPDPPTRDETDFFNAFQSWSTEDQQAYAEAEKNAKKDGGLDPAQVWIMYKICRANGLTHCNQYVKALAIVSRATPEQLNNLKTTQL